MKTVNYFMKLAINDHKLHEYISYLEREEKSHATIEKYTRDIIKFKNFVNDRSIDKQLVLEYKKTLAESYAITSANSMLASINSFFKYFGRHDLCVKQYRIQKQIYCPKERELTKNEYIRLVNTAADRGNQRLALIFQTICSTGIRISELRYITYEAIVHGEAVVSCKGKTRVILIVSRLRKALLKYAKKCGIKEGPIFITSRGHVLDRSNIWRDMKKLCEYAGVMPEKVFPHNLRHLFARAYYLKEKDIVKLADILGHSDINTTRIYTITTYSEHRRNMESLGLIIPYIR